MELSMSVTPPRPRAFGLEIPGSRWRPDRSVVQSPELTAAGNIVLRVGREHPGGWEQTEHVVLTADEWRAFVADGDELLAAGAARDVGADKSAPPEEMRGKEEPCDHPASTSG
jgi:hypothetical protein